MNPAATTPLNGIARFRTKLFVAMMLVVTAVTASGLWFAQRNVAAGAKRDRQREFRAELAALHAAQAVRHAALAERCRALARKPRIHAALEDNALDLLYPNARDELADVLARSDRAGAEHSAYALRARFYRFLDGRGAVIPPPPGTDAGPLSAEEEAQLALSGVPDRPQIGYLARRADAATHAPDEVLAMPIVSTETGEPIAAIVLGFPSEATGAAGGAGIRRGLWLNGELQLRELSAPARAALAAVVAPALVAPAATENSLAVEIDGAPHLLFYQRLNPDSRYPPAYEVCLYPLAESLARQRLLLWQFVGAGALLFVVALAVSQFLAVRLARPVEQLAVDSEEHRAKRARAEAALELTSEELQRSARFSADASHQLKTPVTVLRAGLEELLAGEKLSLEAREEIGALVHQTFRLTSIIEDLLLLSRMDAGRLRLELSAVDLVPLLEAWLDDFSVLTDDRELAVETDFPPTLPVEGEKRYTTLILQNLLENARKYNRPGGRIRIAARPDGEWVVLTVGNTGRPIPPEAQSHIFERFHRGAVAENVPGHGLGLNLARELARLHGGELRLSRSDEEWTEFAVRFRATKSATAAEAATP
ncbi:MAG: HAMP domain-containing histidine kinase [Opitutae bacterium]|nr:HAMP domain-containing histidine kinase [Opitutae bacterium]